MLSRSSDIFIYYFHDHVLKYNDKSRKTEVINNKTKTQKQTVLVERKRKRKCIDIIT